MKQKKGKLEEKKKASCPPLSLPILIIEIPDLMNGNSVSGVRGKPSE